MASISLNSILEVKPSTWTQESYTGKNCVTVQLSRYSTEYLQIETDLQSKGVYASISQIKRVQHPFAYGRFLIRKDQLEKRNCFSSLTRKFYRVLKSEVEEALEYNLDDRRTSSICSLSSDSMCNDDYCVIITQRLHNEYCSNTRDSEEYPEYVIYFV